MRDFAEPALPPDVDPALWFDGAPCGRHYVVTGNPHTVRGLMWAYCPEQGTYLPFSPGGVDGCSVPTRYFIQGFLSGNEPPPPTGDDGEPLPEADPRLAAWRRAVREFHRTGQWADPQAKSPDPGTPDPGTPAPGTPDPGTPDGPTPDPPGGTPHRIPLFGAILDRLREAGTVRVGVVVDVPSAAPRPAVAVTRAVLDRIASRIGAVPSDGSVGDPVTVTRVWALVGPTELRPRAAVETVVTALGRAGWGPTTAVAGEQYVSAGWRAEGGANPELAGLGVVAVEVHAAEGLGVWPPRTPGGPPGPRRGG